MIIGLLISACIGAVSKPAGKCPKCDGKGTIKVWEDCPECGGRGWKAGRCRNCVRSIQLGKIRKEITCPLCGGVPPPAPTPPQPQQPQNTEVEQQDDGSKDSAAVAEPAQEPQAVTTNNYDSAVAITKLPSWTSRYNIDEMTDKTTYTFSVKGVLVKDGNIDYHPLLKLQVEPLSYTVSTCTVKYKHSVSVITDEAISADLKKNTTVMLRVDSKKPVTSQRQVIANSHGISLPESTLASLDEAQTFLVRFKTLSGEIRTLKFRLSGFTVAGMEKDLIELITKERPQGIAITE